jgi:uncharacterized membrane protein
MASKDGEVSHVQLDDHVDRETIEISYRSGPLPPASEFQEYDAVLPGSAERIIRQFEIEADARRADKRKRTDAEIERGARGQHYAFSLALGFLAIAALALYLNQPWIAGVFGIGTASAIVLGFLTDGKTALHSRSHNPESQRLPGKKN